MLAILGCLIKKFRHVPFGLPTTIQRSRVCASARSHITFVHVVHEIISAAILLLPLIQVGYLSVTGERMCTFVLVNRLGLSLPRKV